MGFDLTGLDPTVNKIYPQRYNDIMNKYGIILLIKSFLKSIFYIFFKKSKSITHFAKAYGVFYAILNLKPSYRPKIKL